MKGESLVSGGNNNHLTLENLELRMQSDGDLVTLKHLGGGKTEKLYSSGTKADTPNGPYTLMMQHDNNLVIYDKADKAIWSSEDKAKWADGSKW